MFRLTVIAIAAALFAANADAQAYRTPRTAWGAPDLQGLWTNSSVTMLQRPKMFKNLNVTDAEAAMMEGGFRKMVEPIVGKAPIDPDTPAPPVVNNVENADFLEMDMNLARIDGKKRSSWIIDPADGRLPFTEAGLKANHASPPNPYDGPEGRPLAERCLTAIGSPEGPPMMNTAFNPHYQIVQTPSHVVVHIEMNHDVRIIRLGDRRHGPVGAPSWLGDSMGWWEGDTLVIETANLDPKGYVSSLGGGFPYSPQTRVIERFTRTAEDQMLYEFKVEDPLIFTQPWRGEMPWRTAKGPIYEYACHEGNYSLPNALSGARAQEREAAGPVAR